MKPTEWEMSVYEARELLERLSRDWDSLSEEEKHGTVRQVIEVLD